MQLHEDTPARQSLTYVPKPVKKNPTKQQQKTGYTKTTWISMITKQLKEAYNMTLEAMIKANDRDH